MKDDISISEGFVGLIFTACFWLNVYALIKPSYYLYRVYKGSTQLSNYQTGMEWLLLSSGLIAAFVFSGVLLRYQSESDMTTPVIMISVVFGALSYFYYTTYIHLANKLLVCFVLLVVIVLYGLYCIANKLYDRWYYR